MFLLSFQTNSFPNSILKKEPIESLFRSVLLVLMDNGTAEYTFLATFFAPPPKYDQPSESYNNLFSPLPRQESRRPSGVADEITSPPPHHVRMSSSKSNIHDIANEQHVKLSKEDEAALTATWKQIFEPTLQYCQVRLTTYCNRRTYDNTDICYLDPRVATFGHTLAYNDSNG